MENNSETIITEQPQTNNESNIMSVFAEESVDSILDSLNIPNIQTSSEEIHVDTTQIGMSNIDDVLEAVHSLLIQDGIATEGTMQGTTASTEPGNEHTESSERTETTENTVSPMDELDVIENDFNILNDGIRENTSRFSGAEWFNNVNGFRIVIAGLGGIGSWLSFLVSRINPAKIFVFDDDYIEEANLSGQLFSRNNIGNPKSSEVRSMAIEFSEFYNISSYNERYTGQVKEDIMICGFDNMASRKMFFEAWKLYASRKDDSLKKNCLYIDGRLGMEELQVFAIRGDEIENMKRYETEYLFNDSQAEQVPCSMKQTSFMASMIGSVMTNILVNHAVNIDKPMDIRPIPFITLYDAESMRMQLKF